MATLTKPELHLVGQADLARTAATEALANNDATQVAAQLEWASAYYAEAAVEIRLRLSMTKGAA